MSLRCSLLETLAKRLRRARAASISPYRVRMSARARTVLGSAGIVGTACGLSRHAAMESAEAGADFIAFDASNPETWEQAAELSLWWDEISGVPVALAFGAARPDESVLTKARPDFLMIEEAHRAGESLTFATEFGLQSQT